MKYNHVVNLNGRYYAAGEDVPTYENDRMEKGEPEGLPFSDSDIEFETKESRYTYDDLDGMTVREIKRKAEDLGFSITKTIKSDVIAEFLEKQP